MRLGLFGGTFDPIHLGHLILAEQCREQCQLDKVWFLPSGDPPHKPTSSITPGKQRTEMIEFAIAGHEHFSVNSMELDREGTTFTVQTLEELKLAHDSRELFFLIGADSLTDFPTWRSPERILELATLVAVNRGNAHPQPIEPLIEALGPLAKTRIQQLQIPDIEISSSDIRTRIQQGKSIRYLVPRSVEVYIADQKVYPQQS